MPAETAIFEAIELPEEAVERIVGLLAEPPAPNPELRAAAARFVSKACAALREVTPGQDDREK